MPVSRRTSTHVGCGGTAHRPGDVRRVGSRWPAQRDRDTTSDSPGVSRHEVRRSSVADRDRSPVLSAGPMTPGPARKASHCPGTCGCWVPGSPSSSTSSRARTDDAASTITRSRSRGRRLLPRGVPSRRSSGDNWLAPPPSLPRPTLPADTTDEGMQTLMARPGAIAHTQTGDDCSVGNDHGRLPRATLGGVLGLTPPRAANDASPCRRLGKA
jgi:hypothetical protein